jgi:hypothetical protein
MTTPKDHDTDPSTPSSKRLSEPRTAAAAVSLEDAPSATDDPSSKAEPREAKAGETPPTPFRGFVRGQRLGLVRSRPTTDPGIAPPPQPLPALRQPMGIVVPPVAPHANDSVDVLLDGMTEEGSGGAPTIPQTDGQAKATYHSEHSVRAAQRALGDEPKVVIERPLLAQTVRVHRSQVALPDADLKAWADTTSVRLKPMAGRVAIAILAGMVVVMLIFGALQRMSGERADAPTPTGTPMAMTAAVPAVVATASVMESTALTPAPPETTIMPTTALAESHASATGAGGAGAASAASSAPRKPPTAGKPSKQKPKASPSAVKPAGDDLGEFKSAL